MGKWLGPPHGEIPRCKARARSGARCGQYAMKNGCCRFHGGKSTGARSPYRSIKNGMYTKEAIFEYRILHEVLCDALELLEKF